jgi:hypothetical protein
VDGVGALTHVEATISGYTIGMSQQSPQPNRAPAWQ